MCFLCRLRLVVAACLMAGLVGGCTTLMVETAGSPSSLPTPKMSPDTVVLEVATVIIAPGDEARAETIWQAIDEQHLPGELRRALGANGLRCGLIGSRMPPELEKLLAVQADRPKAPRAPTADPDAPLSDSDIAVIDAERVDEQPRPERRRLQSRAGRRGEILTTQVRPTMTLVEATADGQVRGKEYRQAQGLFAVISHPQGDGRVRIELLPEVQHGEPKQRFIGHEGVFHVELARDRESFDALRIETLLAAGQTLALSCTDDPRGLGRQFFVDSAGPLPGRKILLIRLAQTQFDDLFAPEQIVAPLVNGE